ncbi:tyrosinase family protein [Vibrio kanaloae]|uniref:tyrosinase family protein n=1 Tax=Vibrio kanaloae TaxID=170673 RepID=UPI00148D632E|nr:tyrosinase family protein [Vibrio kanaloae]NOH99796.1 tyrosinase family protein [Vibrio kanaloae]
MTLRVRSNITGQSTSDPTTSLYWYEKAVSLMRGREVTDPTSWGWWAAVHRYNFQSPFWHKTYDGDKPWVTGLDNEITPGAHEFLAKCPHGSFYFLAWHRQYLLAFENAIRAVLSEVPGAPENWALPYWDYTTSGTGNMVIPETFRNEGNALYFPDRNYSNNLDFYDQTVESVSDEPFFEFGGTQAHIGGSLESYPHNVVHGAVSGAMADISTAGLDPLFYLHHANIDRLWSIWTALGGVVELDGSDPYPGKEYAFKWFHDGKVTDVSLALTNFSETENIVITAPSQSVIETVDYEYDGASGLKKFIEDVNTARHPDIAADAFIQFAEAGAMPVQRPSDIDTLIVGDAAQPVVIRDKAQTVSLQLLEKSLFSHTLIQCKTANHAKHIRGVKLNIEGVETAGTPANYRVTVIENDENQQPSGQRWDLGVVSFFGSTVENGKTQLFDGTPMATSVRVPKRFVMDVCHHMLDRGSLSVELAPDGETTDCGEVSIRKITLSFDTAS